MIYADANTAHMLKHTSKHTNVKETSRSITTCASPAKKKKFQSLNDTRFHSFLTAHDVTQKGGLESQSGKTFILHNHTHTHTLGPWEKKFL